MPSKTDIIEALLFAADRPVPLEKLAQIAELTPEGTLGEIEALRVEKDGIGALQLIEMAGGYQFVTKAQFAPFIRRLRDEKKQKLSRAAFEVLAIIAYRQPATRSDVDSLRGVESAGPLQFLLEKKLIALAGRKEVPGRPWLYRTTPQFLDQFGLNSLDDLPDLEEFTALENAGGHPQTMNLFGRGSIHPLPDVVQPGEGSEEESGSEDESGAEDEGGSGAEEGTQEPAGSEAERAAGGEAQGTVVAAATAQAPDEGAENSGPADPASGHGPEHATPETCPAGEQPVEPRAAVETEEPAPESGVSGEADATVEPAPGPETTDAE